MLQTKITESVTRYEGDLGIGDYNAARRGAKAKHRRRVIEAARLIADVAEGRQDPFLLRQAFKPTEDYGVAKLMESYPDLVMRENVLGGMSITDFSILTVDVLDRILYGYYTATPIVSQPMMRMHPLRDFRNVSRYLIDGGTTPPEQVPPGAQVKEKTVSQEAIIQYAPAKYEAFFRMVWEALINDDLGMFTDLGKRLNIGAQRGIELAMTGLYVDASGPNAKLYKTAFTNQIITANGAATNNPALDAQGLQDAFKVFARMLDPDGYPIILSGRMNLWYGPALVATVQNLMHQISVQLSTNGGTANAQGFPTQFVQVNNWMIQNINPIMNPFIRLVCTTATTQDTMWGITLDPANQDRPAMEFGFLNGFEAPVLLSKVPNTMRAGGGGVDASLGDFSTMSQEMKVLTVYGGTQVDGRSTVASTGRGV